MKRYPFFIICSLLFLLPVVAWGQTTAFSESHTPRYPRVRPKEGVKWWKMLYDGGMTRTASGQWYMEIPDGINDLSVMNFVDGYSFGPHAIFGYMSPSRQRFEVEETVRWAVSREAWLAKGALRWYSPVERAVMVELHGGRHTEDYDHDPTMPMSQSLLATGIFGWNHYKLLERTDAGLRLAFPVGNDLDVRMHLAWERRREMENHKLTTIFGTHGQDNVPRLRVGKTASELMLYEGETDGDMALLNLEFNYQFGQQHVVFDDMTCLSRSSYPRFSLLTDLGMGKWHFASFDLRISGDNNLSRGEDELSYLVSGGAIYKHGDLSLTDWHHLDASRFWWQKDNALSRFVLLDNYELSTDRSWMEGHIQWASDRMLLTWLTRNGMFLKEYVQAHVVKVPTHRPHWELQYGIDLFRFWKFGVAVGFDDMTCRGAAFIMSLDINKAKNFKKDSKGF